MTWSLWLGGLDTVASTVSQMFRRLAMHPELQTQIREDKGLINSAVEDFLRTQPLVNSGRKVKRGFEWHGVKLKAGDWVRVFNTSGNLDPDQFECPPRVDPARTNNCPSPLEGGAPIFQGPHL